MCKTDKRHKIVYEDSKGVLVHGPHSVYSVPKVKTTWTKPYELEEENKKLKKENRQLKKLLKNWDALISHQYSGSKEAMSDLMHVAQLTAKKLYGKPPYPKISKI